MNDRLLPTELAAGTIETVEPQLSDIEERRERFRAGLRRGDEVLTLPARRWIVRSWLPLDALVAIYAAPGAGKTFYAVTLGLELARGDKWLDKLERPYRVLYVAAEKPSDIRDRAQAWSTAGGQPIPTAFVMLTERPNLAGDGFDVQIICDVIAEERIDVVILDTYAAVTPGLDENTTRDTGEVMRKLDRIREATAGGTVIVVHHSRKTAARNDPAAMRGSTAFLAACDLTIELEQQSAAALKASVTKANAGATPQPENYRLEPVQLPSLPGDNVARSVPRLIHTGAPVLDGTWLQIILGLFDSGGYFDVPAGTKQIEEALADAGHSLSRATLNRHLKAATESEHLTKSGTDTRPRYFPTRQHVAGTLSDLSDEGDC